MPTSSTPATAVASALDFTTELREVNERLLLSSLREREACEAAQDHQKRLSALLEALHEGVLITDGAGRVLVLNAAARRMMGAGDRSDQVALDSALALDVRRPDMTALAVSDRPLERAMRGEALVDEEVVLVRAAGDVRHLMTSSTFTMEGDKVALAIVVFRDVTERRDLEARIAQAERLAALGTLAAGVAHEINNPLVYVMSNIELVIAELQASDSGSLPAQLRQLESMLLDARVGAERIRNTVRALSTFSRDGTVHRSVVQVVPSLELSIKIAFNEIRHHARLVRDFGPVPDVEVDDALLGQVFVNLLINAVHALAGGDAEQNEIRVVTATDAEGRAVIEVSDTGPGIPDDILPRIFDPFFTTKEVGQGTGLGLSISRNTVAATGGELSVKSVPGHGTTFRVVLPPALHVREGSLSRAGASPASVADLETRRGVVLVVDDERAIGVILARILQGHEVTVVGSADEALALIASGSIFDIILSDIMMPGKSGIDLYEALRTISPEHADRVVFLSGGAFSAGAHEFLQTVPNERIDKPFEASVVRSIVSRFVTAPHGHSGRASVARVERSDR